MPTPFSPPFPPASRADWLNQVQKDLKDSNIYESLRWESPEGFMVEPYYTDAGLDPQQLAFVHNVQKSTPGWLNTPHYFALPGQERSLNTRLRDALANGADALVLNVPDWSDASAGSPHSLSLTRLLDGIKLSNTPVFFRLGAGNQAVSFLQTLRQVAPYQLKGGMLTESGTAHPPTAGLPIGALAELIEQSSESPNFRVIGINSHDFHAAGGTATQELAFTLARLAEVYGQLLESGLTVEQLASKTVLSVSVGTSYFMEMAKLRALRVLFARFAPSAASQTLLIHGQTSTFYEATATPYTNLLRATTEAMAAIIGGIDALTVRPYDAVLSTLGTLPESHPTEFSERIARNVSTLLKAESYLDKVTDPAAGSYYIENLTHQLTEAAWALFQQVEAMGGFTKALENGFIQQHLDKAFAAKVDAVRNGRILVGVTKFRHDEEGAETNPIPSEGDDIGLKTRRLANEFE
ncbi:methylmalonyl-CoA mutase family protein [uncultured Fibrella sp.]|uniref:methylmalonyl-CoA mutase family protein n=1 Tax=uncultured Fibrella sp. TaxID=1284596 RepID=UPI0035CAFDB8